MRQTEIPRSGPIARILSRTAAVLAFLLLSTSTASAWESDFYDMGSYVGISGLGAIMDLGSTLGDAGSAPIRGISSVRDSGGFRISAGTHVTPWAALQIDFQYVAPVKFESTSNGTQRIPIYTGSLTLKGYPLAKLLESTLEGRLQPFVKVSPSVSGLAHTPIKTPIAFTVGVGGGTEYWLNESFTVNIEGAYWWGTAALKHLNYGTLSLGAAYHF
jgi:opacity protein-like surface antigen